MPGNIGPGKARQAGLEQTRGKKRELYGGYRNGRVRVWGTGAWLAWPYCCC
jgi:hypothetical protein